MQSIRLVAEESRDTVLITVCTFGICSPFAPVLRERWRAKHSSIDGFPLVVTGSAWALFGNWLTWLVLSSITLGIYLFWVGPRIQQWKWEHTDVDRRRYPLPLTDLQQVQPLGITCRRSPGAPEGSRANGRRRVRTGRCCRGCPRGR